MGSQIKVFFSGQIKEGFEPQQVRENLAKLHQVSLEKIEALFTGKRKLVKVVSEYAAAEKVQQVYSTAGAVCIIDPPPTTQLKKDAAKKTTVVRDSVAKSTTEGGVQQGETGQGANGDEEIVADDPISPNIFVSDALEALSVKFEVLTYRSLSGSDNLAVAGMLYHAQHSGVRLKQVRITLEESEVILEAGALHFQKGEIEIESKVGGAGGFLKKFITNKLTDEAAFKPTYRGSGEIYLEPGFGHYILLSLDDEELVADKGMFLACEKSIDVGVATQKSIKAGLLGGEGFFQTRLSGKGICVLQSPVPIQEIIKVKLQDETLQVDGNFALLRKGDVEFSVKAAAQSLVGSMTSGEGLLQTFYGTGEVWLAPTQSVYQQLAFSGISGSGKGGGVRAR
jgi:uncharacterized protein (AIM24 family)